jgi:predicted RNase H-like nuclease (RuvC/YqgF family)
MSATVPTDEAPLMARIRELEERLDRERARNAGLERGLSALSRTVAELREENARLRRDIVD